VNRWEYLNTSPYRVRHVMAAHFMVGLSSVVEVGAFRVPCPIPGVVAVDPLGVTPGAFHGSVAQWVDQHDWRPEGVVALGLDLESGDADREFAALAELVDGARVSVLECAVEHANGRVQMGRLVAGREVVADIGLSLPQVDVEGFRVYGQRRMVVIGDLS
jgi:hypothetical protein